MAKTILVKWNGDSATRIRTAPNGEKITLEPGATAEVEESLAKYYKGYSKDFEIVEGKPAKEDDKVAGRKKDIVALEKLKKAEI